MSPRWFVRLTIAALGVLLMLFVACSGLGPDELPREIGNDEREEIADTIEDFLDGVNRYNPQVATEVMLIPAELGMPGVERMIREIGALQAEGLRFELLSLGSTSLQFGAREEADFVLAVAVTSLGHVDIELVRRDGEWRLSRAPRLSVSPEDGPVVIEATIARVDFTGSGQRIVVGEVENRGATNAQIVMITLVLDDRAGRTQFVSAAYIAESILKPGESAAFRADVRALGGIDDERISIVVAAQEVAESDFALFESLNVQVEGVERVRSADGISVRGVLQNLMLDPVLVFPAAVAFDADGVLLALGPGPGNGLRLQGGEERVIEIALADLTSLGIASELSGVELVFLSFPDLR